MVTHRVVVSVQLFAKITGSVLRVLLLEVIPLFGIMIYVTSLLRLCLRCALMYVLNLHCSHSLGKLLIMLLQMWKMVPEWMFVLLVFGAIIVRGPILM